MPPKTRGVRKVAQLVTPRTGNTDADRAQKQVATAVNTLSAHPVAHSIPIEVELLWGHNKVDHGLGVPVRKVVPGAASDPRAQVTSDQENCTEPDKQVWVFLDGAPEASVLLFLLPQV